MQCNRQKKSHGMMDLKETKMTGCSFLGCTLRRAVSQELSPLIVLANNFSVQAEMNCRPRSPKSCTIITAGGIAPSSASRVRPAGR